MRKTPFLLLLLLASACSPVAPTTANNSVWAYDCFANGVAYRSTTPCPGNTTVIPKR